MQAGTRQASRDGTRSHRLVRIVYLARACSFFFCFAVIGVHCWERGHGALTWVSLALTFLAYPHLAYLHARYSRDPKSAEHRNLLFDAFLLGAWAAQLGFPVWITYPLLSATLLNNLVNHGLRGLLPSLGMFAIGAALWGTLRGFAYLPDTSLLVTALCFVSSLAYACLVGVIVHRQTRHVVRAREELRMSEERYRLIAENAGDLIAMVDAQGRWRYASPSYARILAPEDLLLGTSAFGCVHPEDRDKARSAVRRMMETGANAAFRMRLVGPDGRVRVLDVNGHPASQVAGQAAGEASRAVLVSHDVTELQSSREQLEVAALAFENMSEAIMIVAADGRIVTVNKSFCRITGFEAAEAVGQHESTFRLAMQPTEFYDDMYADVLREGHWAGSTWARRKDGGVYREWRTVSAVRDEKERVAYYVAVFSEMDAGKRAVGVNS